MSAPPDKTALDLAILRAARNLHDDAFLCAARSDGRNVPMLDEAGERLGYHPKVVARRIEALIYRHGLLEFGVSERTAWLTDKGKARLASLETTERIGIMIGDLDRSVPGFAAAIASDLAAAAIRQRE